MSTVKIRLRGLELPKEISQAEDQAMGYYNVSKVYTIENSTRSDVPEQVLELNEDEILELNFEDNSVWLGDSDSIKQIFSKELKRGVEGDEIYLSGEIETDAQDRSIVQKVVLKAAKVFVKNQVIRPGIRHLAVKAENSALKFGGKTFEGEGAAVVLSVGEDFDLALADFSKVDLSKKCLLFIHGTGSSTLGSFAEMKGTDEWHTMVSNYGPDNLLALQHRTLTCSPLENVLAGLESLPDGITLDLITHSRGGLVGDLLARFASHKVGFDEEERKVLSKSDREGDLKMIQKISELLDSKSIAIDRLVRVACPANGTTLASKRLDMFLNVVINLLGITVGSISNPVFASMKELVLASIETKDDVGVLPGLESMNPDSPFINVLNFQGTKLEVDSKLIVVAGSSELSVSFKSLVVLVGKFFFRGKNDLVVDTASMEFGAKRKAGNVFLYMEETGQIDHIKYFKTPKVRKIIIAALFGNPEEFSGKTRTDGITFLRGEERDRGGLFLDGGRYLGTEQITGKKPILILLPGIMGSNLKDDQDLLWVHYARFLVGDLKFLQPKESDGIGADSLIKTSYKKLGDYLEKNYEVVAFPFDWRLGMEGNAQLLNQKITDLLKLGQPIKMVGHSMGGVLIRDFILYHPDTFQQLNDLPGFKILLLGAPLGGSYRIPYVLFGKDGIIKLLAKIDIFNTAKDLISVFANFPGILALLPINRSGKHDFSDRSFWEKLRKAAGDDSWPIPNDTDLRAFGKYQEKILADEKKINYDNIYYIAGQSRIKKSTIADLEIKDGKLLFHATNQGDESVTWERGIPKAILESNRLYYANVTHGSLSAEKKIFGAIEDILKQGVTGRLQNNLPKGRGDEPNFLAKEEEIFDISEENTIQTILGIGQDGEVREHETPIHVKVCHGDLTYADFPVLSGHFQYDTILTTERVIDRKLGNELSRLLTLGLYPGPIGTHQIVLTKDIISEEKLFKGTVVVGLGVPGELTPYQLMMTVSKGIARYLTIRNVCEDESGIRESKGEMEDEKGETLGISIIALATSYGGFSSDTSIRSIILGIQDANRNIRKVYGNKLKVIEQIEIIELFHDRALGILRSVKNLEQDESREFNISVPSLCLTHKLGRLSRIPHDNTSDWWTRIKVTEEKFEEETKTGFGRTIRMAMATNGASEKEIPLLANLSNIENMLDGMTRKNQFEPEIAKTLFELLIPFEFKEDLKRQNNITWVLDKRTANFPWEMLQEDLKGIPLCIHSGMVRQLATTNFRNLANNVQDKRALIVGDPDLKGFMGQLKGAEMEASQVAVKLKDAGYATETLIKSTASEIILKFFTQEYKIVHLAGHGVFHSDSRKPSGMVIGNGQYLTTSDIAQLSKVPELVFVNCCYLGRLDAGAEELNQNRNKLAANIGTQLIEIGVKAVIVAGWAVDDSAALDFCDRFYECLFSGATFGDAVKSARKTIYEDHHTRTNTWGAYQCYGDPFYKIEGPLTLDKSGTDFYLQEEVEIELYNLCFQLESKNIGSDDARKKICLLEDGLKQANLSSEKILEYKADVYAKLGDYASSKSAYEQLFLHEQSGFTFKAIEQYCNIVGKYLVEQIHLQKGDTSKSVEFIAILDDTIQKLQGLLAIGKTSERYSLLGSAYKRKLMLLPPKDKKLFSETLLLSANAYFEAAKMKNLGDSYSINNCLQLGRINELISGSKLNFSEDKERLSLDNLLARFKRSYNSKSDSKKNFWDYAAESNLLLSALMLSPSSAKIEKVKDAYRQLWDIAGSQSKQKTELEHLDILIKGLSMADSEEAKSLREEMEELKKGLLVLN